MVNRLRFSRVDILLLIILVAGAVFAFSLRQTNADVELEKVRLENSVRAQEASLRQIKPADLESIRPSLQQAEAAVAKNPFPKELEAVAVTTQIIQYTRENKISIINWDFGYTTATLKGRQYPAISHSLGLEGGASALTRFLQALTQGSAAHVIREIDIAGVTGGTDRWQMQLELLVYYR